MRKKLQVTLNKCILLLFKTQLKPTLGAKEFKGINWQQKKVEQRVGTKVFKYWKGNLVVMVERSTIYKFVNKKFVSN